MLFSKGTKPLPIGDPWLAAYLGIHLGSKAASRRFTLESQVDGVTTDAKDATGFPLPHPIQFDGIDDFLAQIKAVGFRYGTQGERSIFLAYILTTMATSIFPIFPGQEMTVDNTILQLVGIALSVLIIYYGFVA